MQEDTKRFYDLTAEQTTASSFDFVRDGYLDPEETERGWRCYIFQVRKG
jgi:hypothetical protein